MNYTIEEYCFYQPRKSHEFAKLTVHSYFYVSPKAAQLIPFNPHAEGDLYILYSVVETVLHRALIFI